MATELRGYEAELLLARRKRAQNPDSLIGRGSQHRAAVRAIQQRLTDLGFGVSSDGIFGDETEKALRDFQKSRNAKVDGIVGQETLGKLLRSHKAKPPSAADTGLDAVQRVVEAGRPLPNQRQEHKALGEVRAEEHGGGQTSKTGGTKARTGTTFKTQKGSHGGTVDATGHETATAQTGPIGSTKPFQPKTLRQPGQTQPTNPEFEQQHPREHGKFVQKGDSGEQVSQTQSQLNKTGQFKLKKDGIFGVKTAHAVRSFQRQHNLNVDGVVGPKTRLMLRHVIRKHRTAA